MTEGCLVVYKVALSAGLDRRHPTCRGRRYRALRIEGLNNPPPPPNKLFTFPFLRLGHPVVLSRMISFRPCEPWSFDTSCSGREIGKAGRQPAELDMGIHCTLAGLYGM